MEVKHENTLYPVFLKLQRLRLLIVGGGAVAREKLHFIIKSSPDAHITVMAPEIDEAILDIFIKHTFQINLIHERFDPYLLPHFDLVIAATNDCTVNHQIHQACKSAGILINVADTPDLCDFYLGSIVTRGNLKIAVSTNGKSPTFAKRFRQLLEDALPEEVDGLLTNLRTLRDRLQGGFSEKVTYLNEVTKSLIS
ncbi:MAG: bifunctional precorrin-2 dehydrogenase/sirohydrochlorin ferrochelatase [Saprospiraceae bacterium]|nr:bifunctional precorrin-2 dehydrogenase/sirohydrochlorin ferrochelatase [Saprospiraceae bacterium]